MKQKVRTEAGKNSEGWPFQEIIWEEDLCFIRERTIFAPRRTFTLFAGAYDPDIPTWIGPFPSYERVLEYLRPGWRSISRTVDAGFTVR